MLIPPPPLAVVHVVLSRSDDVGLQLPEHAAALADLAVDLDALDALDKVPAERAQKVAGVFRVVREQVADQERGEGFSRGRAEALLEQVDAGCDVWC